MWENIRWLGTALIIALVLIVLIIGACISSVAINKAYIEGGYSRDSVMGSDMVQWVKK